MPGLFYGGVPDFLTNLLEQFYKSEEQKQDPMYGSQTQVDGAAPNRTAFIGSDKNMDPRMKLKDQLFWENFYGANSDDARERLRQQVVSQQASAGREKLGKQIDDMMFAATLEQGGQAYDKSQPSWFSQTPLGQDLAPYTEDGKVQLPFNPGPAISGIAEKKTPEDEILLPQSVDSSDGLSMHDRAQQAIGNRLAVEEVAAQKQKEEQEAAKEYLLRMQQAKEQDEFVRSVDYEPDQTFSSPEQGILMKEVDPAKLALIRAQAKLKGDRGSLRGGNRADDLAAAQQGLTPGGGGFTTAEQSPELIMRQAANESWANQQPIRDAEFALSREQVQRSPDRAAIARDTLGSMEKSRALEREQMMQSNLVKALGSNNGVIPFDQAQKLQAAGVRIPYSSIGTSPQDAIATFDSAIEAAGRKLSSVNPLDIIGNESAKNRIMIERHGAALAEQYKMKVAQGMNPDDALRQFQQQMAQMIMEAGLMNTNEMVAPPEAQ